MRDAAKIRVELAKVQAEIMRPRQLSGRRRGLLRKRDRLLLELHRGQETERAG